MIYTVTFNPSLDYIVRVNNFRPGVINRTFYEKILPGGKGINVSIVLSSLGHDSIALGFMAGFTGEDIEELLKGFGCGTDFIRVKEGFSRINVKMRSDEETEINGQGLSSLRKISACSMRSWTTLFPAISWSSPEAFPVRSPRMYMSGSWRDFRAGISA